MLTSENGEKFNDDLLLEEEDQNLASKRYPTIFHILNHEKLRTTFREIDMYGNKAKRQGRLAGFWSIALVYFALALPSSEYILEKFATHDKGDSDEYFHILAQIVPVVSAIMGVLGVIIGSAGLLFASRKEEWLKSRLKTERLRQFHFQIMVFKLPEVIDSLSGSASRERFEQNREIWFDTFKGQILDKISAEFTNVTENDERSYFLFDGGSKIKIGRSIRELEPIFCAYRDLRIRHQLNYCLFKLREDYKIFSSAPKRQADLLQNTGLICIIIIFAIHVIAFFWSLVSPSMWSETASVFANLFVVAIAFAALAVRSIEHGLQPEREIERYQQYKSAILSILEQFDQARTQEEKIRVMQIMERATYDEMCNFIVTNNKTKFVM